MEKYFKKYAVRSVLISLLLIVLSIILICNPIKLLNSISIILGILIILDGIWHIVSYFNEPAEFRAFSFELLEGILEIVLGFIFIKNPAWIISIIYLVLGIGIIFESIIKIQMSLNLKNVFENWLPVIIVSVITILFGIFIIAHPFVATEILSIICGISLLITGLINLIESIYLCIKIKN